VEEVAAGIRARMQDAVQAESARVADLDGRKAGLQAAVSNAEGDLAAVVAVVDAKKNELAEASAWLLQQKRALVEAEDKTKQDATNLEEIQARKVGMEAVISESFQKLKSGEWQLGEEDELFKPTQTLIAKLVFDESLVSSLPVSLKKKERGAFDQVVVAKFEEALADKVGDLVAVISSIQTTVTANEVAVEESKAALDVAQVKQQAVASEFGAAQESSTKAATSVKEAQDVLAAFEPEYLGATAARQEKQEELEGFEAYHLCILSTMVERVSKKREAELAQEVAAAASAAGVAEVAAAAASDAASTAPAIAAVADRDSERVDVDEAKVRVVKDDGAVAQASADATQA